MLAAISIRNRWLIARQTLCSLLTLDTPKSWPRCCCEHISQPSDSQTGQHWQSQARHFGGRILYDGRQHRHPAACILEWSRTGRQRCWLDGSQQGRRQSTSPAGPVVQFPLAQPGEGIKECELIKWFVKVRCSNCYNSSSSRSRSSSPWAAAGEALQSLQCRARAGSILRPPCTT